MIQNSRQKHFATFWIHCETAKFSAWKFFDNKVIQTACHKNFDHENLSCRNKIRSFGKELLKELFSSENAHFLNKNLCEPLEVIQSGNKLLTDLYIKPPDTHQHLEFSSCHVYRLKKPIPNGQPLRFNRICSENRFFDNSSINLSADLKIEVTKKKFLDNKFWKQENSAGKIYLTKIPKLRGETNLSLILLTIQPIQNLNIFYCILTSC